MHLIIQPRPHWLRTGRMLIVIQRKLRVRRRGRGLEDLSRRVELDPACEHRLQRARANGQSTSTGRYRNYTDIPEETFMMHQLVVRGANENQNIDPRASVSKFVAGHLTHRNAVIVNRRPAIE